MAVDGRLPTHSHHRHSPGGGGELVELKRRLAWVPEAAWWIGGFFVLFALVCAVARQQHLALEKETAQQGQRVKSLDEAIERERSKRLD